MAVLQLQLGALATLPGIPFADDEEILEEKGRRLEFEFGELLARCLALSRDQLHKSRPENDVEYRELVALLASERHLPEPG